ncbi:MAG: hypothetical protein IJC73_06495 [Lentisphaeria bacterium]|nr:hypothetical protein [Lentisphaeria bacterium]
MNRDPLTGFRLGALLATHLGGGRIITARLDDTPMEQHGQQLLEAGLTMAGAAVTDAGVLPLATLRFLIREMNAAGAVAVDGSRWIVCGGTGRVLPPVELDLLLRIGIPGMTGPEQWVEPRPESRGFSLHLRKIMAAVDGEAIRRRQLRVAWCGEGAAVVRRLPELLRKCGADAVAVPDAGAMAAAICDGRCDFGVGMDRRSSAVRLWDDRGRLIPAGHSLAMMLDHILEAFPETLVVTAPTGRFADRLAADAGCDIRRGGDGESGLLDAMQNAGSSLGGDGPSGMLIWRRIQPVPDAFAAVAILLELSALSGAAISEIADQTGGESSV